MSYNKAPTAIIPSYSSDGTDLTIPIASLTGLDSGKADTSTGDNRAILASILDTYYETILALDELDRPAKISVKRDIREVSGVGLRRNYYITVDLTGDLEIPSEPA